MYQKLFELEEDIFKTVANQKRLEIIQVLKHGEQGVSDMVEMLGIRQANLSQHLALLRQQGIVTSRREGLNVYYRLADPRIARAAKLIREFLAEQHGLQPEVSQALKQKNPYPVVRDVVCGMRISVSEAAAHSKYNGETYYFCGGGCKQKFDAKPQRYAKEPA